MVPSKVLVVDDDPMVCELIQEVLTSAEIGAQVTSDSAHASALLKEQKFDAVFLDVRMPEPDGIELARQMRAGGLNQTTPIVIITGEDDRQVLARAFQAGATFFLYKPMNRQRLLQLVKATEGTIEREKRRYLRVRTEHKVSIEAGQEQFKGITVDLSANGMLVRMPRAIPIGSVVQLTLEIGPQKPSIRATARVVRVIGPDCVGLHLEKVPPGDSEKLQEFLLPLILAVVESEASVTSRD